MPARYIVFVRALLAAGCAVNHAQGGSSIIAPASDAQLCAAQSWPRPPPPVTGWISLRRPMVRSPALTVCVHLRRQVAVASDSLLSRVDMPIRRALLVWHRPL